MFLKSSKPSLHYMFIIALQKQQFRGVLGKRCSENMQQIYRTKFQQNISEWLLLALGENETKEDKP